MAFDPVSAAVEAISSVEANFTIEEIPQGDRVYQRVARNVMENLNWSELNVGRQFREHGTGMSVEWNKYAEPHQVRSRRGARKPASEYGVIRLKVKEVRQNGMLVEHDPLGPDHEFGPNQAHAEVRGINFPDGTPDPEKQMKLSRLAKVVLWPDNPPAPQT